MISRVAALASTLSVVMALATPAPNFAQSSADSSAAVAPDLNFAPRATESLASVTPALTFAPRATDTFWVTGSSAPTAASTHLLRHRFVIAGTERVTRNKKSIQPEVDYRLDAEAGIVRLATPLSAGEVLVVDYAFAPVQLSAEKVGIHPGEPTVIDSSGAPASAAPAPTSSFPLGLEPHLDVAGAKTLALEVGTNKDAAVEQSLRVSVTGMLGPDAKITALLSDQNVPLQPEGNTQRLEELDEVLVKIEASRASATLGDFLSTRAGSGFADYERRLSGAEAQLHVDSSGVHAVAAQTRGNFQSIEFRGIEGKQGPYILAGDGINPLGVIVAGSERVWIDGQLLTRGDSNDYVMDYSRGEIEFTNRRLVTRDSRIAVDYEVSDQEYKRNFYLGEGRASFGGASSSVRASLASETDGDDPLNFTLTEERKSALAAAGDAPVLVPGAVCGVPLGDYNDVAGVFVFAGRDSGTCEVSFTFVGSGAGDYVRDRDLDSGLSFYRHVGTGLGDYIPGLLLPAPRAAALADLGARLDFADVRVAADGAFSREDRNRLSSLDDADNDGSAGQLLLSWGDAGTLRSANTNAGALRRGIETRLRGESGSFVPLGRVREAYLGERWNFEDSTRADETTAEVDSWLEREGRWKVGLSGGRLDRVGRFQSTREEARGEYTRGPRFRASSKVEFVQREDEADSSGTLQGDLFRIRSDLETKWSFLRPGVSYWREDRQEEQNSVLVTGREEEEFAGLLGAEWGEFFSGKVRAARRTADVVADASWMRQSVGTTWETQAEARPSRAARLRSSWIRRALDFEEGASSPDVTTTLTRSDFSHENFADRLRGEYVYETTSRAFVDRVSDPGGEGEPSIALAASARLRLTGARSAASSSDSAKPPSRWARFLRVLESETFARVEEENTSPDRGPLYRLDFSRFQEDSTTVFGKSLLREEVTVFPGGKSFSATFRWERIDTEDNRIDPERLEILSERSVLRARNSLATRWSLESQGTIERETRKDASASVDEFDIVRQEIREEVVLQWTPTRRFTGRSSYLREENRSNGASVVGLTGGLSGQSAVKRSGRLQAELSWTEPRSVEGIDAANRFRTRSTRQYDWRGTFELRLSDSISGSVTLSGRAVEGIPTSHLVRAEARALF